jgi:predicted AlkP superfamily pyrophosphatase or phosphodiesterase
MIPVFPSLTFPNHLSIITGAWPQNHGITHNRMWDPVFEELYFIGEGAAPVQDGKWYEAEPIWVTVEKAGLVAAIYHWPGSEAEIMGYRPSHYNVYDGSISNETKVEQVLAWLDMPEAERPSFMAIYFNEANYYGHRLGVNAPAMDTVIQGLDDDIGLLLSGLEEHALLNEVNIIIVADHGMVDISEDRIIFIDDYISLQDLVFYGLNPISMLAPPEGRLDTVYQSLRGAHPNYSVYLKNELPEHLHYGDHRRIPPIVGIPDEGWTVTTHEYYDNNGFGTYKATHGYDPTLSSMQAIFLAAGPSFKAGITAPKFQNIHLYSLMAAILDLNGAPNDGSLDSVAFMLDER